MKLPFVSIVIPTLNEEAYIEKTLNSASNQIYNSKYEIIVADGMSKDRTLEIAKKYTDKIITVKKRGISIGRNSGARIAKGDIFIFLDSDTLMLPNTLHELVKPFLGKNVVGATCPIIPLSNKIQDFIIFSFLNEFVRFSIKVGKAHVPGVFIACTSNAFKKIHGFNENIHTSEDTDFSIRLNKLGKIAYADKTKIFTSVRRLEKWGRTKAVLKYSNTYLNYILNKDALNVKKFSPVL